MSMNPLLTSLDEHKIDNEKYHISTEFFTNYSFLFYGFEIKNKFDESRLLINKKISPIKFSHLVRTNEGIKIKHFYGVICKGNAIYRIISKKLAYASHKEKYTMSFDNYRHMMSEFNVSTSSSYGKYSIGLYPFDSLSDMSDNVKFDCKDFFANKDVPFYQRMAGLTSYIVCDTSNLIEEI